MTRFLDYQRSRWRVARGTVFNLAVGGIVGGLYVAIRTEQPWVLGLAPPAVAALLLPVAYFAAVRIQDAWVARLVDAYRIVTTSPPK